jgi:transposase-like protein
MSADYVILTVVALVGLGGGFFLLFQVKRHRQAHSNDQPFANFRRRATATTQDAKSDEMRRLKAELKRVTEERDILKKAARYFTKTSG